MTCTAPRVAPRVRLRPWTDADVDLLRRINVPEMMRYLGGPVTDEQVLRRHERFVQICGTGAGQMFSIILLPQEEAVGNIGYWERGWCGDMVYECGWNVLPAYQARGIATAAAAQVVDRARAEQAHRYLHAFTAVDNPASNAVCRKLGFVRVGECDIEYPPGSLMRCADWRRDLTTPADPPG